MWQQVMKNYIFLFSFKTCTIRNFYPFFIAYQQYVCMYLEICKNLEGLKVKGIIAMATTFLNSTLDSLHMSYACFLGLMYLQ